jgi:hypothetical protein
VNFNSILLYHGFSGLVILRLAKQIFLIHFLGCFKSDVSFHNVVLNYYCFVFQVSLQEVAVFGADVAVAIAEVEEVSAVAEAASEIGVDSAAEEHLEVAELLAVEGADVEVLAVAARPSSSSLTDTLESSLLAVRRTLSSHSIIVPERPFTARRGSRSTTRTFRGQTPTDLLKMEQLQLPPPPRPSTESGTRSGPSWPRPFLAASTRFTSCPEPRCSTWERLPEPVSRTSQTSSDQ